MSGRFDEAHEQFRQALKAVPDNARVLTSFGHSLRYGGKGEEAIDVYKKAIAADPDAGEAWWSLANLKTYRFDDEQVAAMQSRLAALEAPSEDKFHLAFALGKAMEDRKEFDASFAAYASGNAIKKKSGGYEHERTTELVDSMIAECGAEQFDERGHPSDEPIFVVGLPRTGSTLLEQILSSHSAVEATSELPFIGQIAGELSGKKKKSDVSRYPGILRELSEEQRVELGQKVSRSCGDLPDGCTAVHRQITE